MKVLEILKKLKWKKAAPPVELKDLRSAEALILDLRDGATFLQGFVPGSLNVPTKDSFGLVGARELMGKARTYLISDSQQQLRQMANRVKEAGFPALLGCFSSSVIGEWQREYGDLAMVEQIDGDTLVVRVAAWKTLVIDVGDGASGHLSEAIQIPLKELSSSLSGLPRATNLTVVCDDSRPGSLAASMLWRLGYQQVSVMWRKAEGARMKGVFLSH